MRLTWRRVAAGAMTCARDRGHARHGERTVADGPADSSTTFGLLPCLADCHVHAVYDPAEPYPFTVCGWNVVPDTYLPDPVLLCRRCLAALPDNANLRPAVNERRLCNEKDRIDFLADFWRWLLTHWYDRRIRRALVAERHR